MHAPLNISAGNNNMRACTLKVKHVRFSSFAYHNKHHMVCLPVISQQLKRPPNAQLLNKFQMNYRIEKYCSRMQIVVKFGIKNLNNKLHLLVSFHFNPFCGFVINNEFKFAWASPDLHSFSLYEESSTVLFNIGSYSILTAEHRNAF